MEFRSYYTTERTVLLSQTKVLLLSLAKVSPPGTWISNQELFQAIVLISYSVEIKCVVIDRFQPHNGEF